MLALDVDFLTGLYRASTLDRGAAEWPPHPERVFSALVDAWGALGRTANGQRALEWLERQAPPAILADGPDAVVARDAPTVFVPPNDPPGTALEVLPAQRKRQARTFHAVRPSTPSVRFVWQERPEAEALKALTAIAAEIAAIGHSTSIVRCAFCLVDDVAPGRAWQPSPDGEHALRTPYEGRLDDLEHWFSGNGKKRERPRTRATTRYAAPAADVTETAPASVFGGPREWVIFEGLSTAPDVLGLAHVARRLRAALMSDSESIPPSLSGHGTGGGPASTPHVAFVPLLNVGYTHSAAEFLGIAAVLPRQLVASERRDIMREVLAFAPENEFGDHVGLLRLTRSFSWNVQRSVQPSRASLRPGRYCARSPVWASVTPLMLDRYPKRGPEEEAEIIAQACEHVGLPSPETVEIYKHSAVTGAPGTYPARGRKERPDWAFPHDARFAERPRRHVVLRFSEPVEGPVLIGAGRYYGFGLCLPWESTL